MLVILYGRDGNRLFCVEFEVKEMFYNSIIYDRCDGFQMEIKKKTCSICHCRENMKRFFVRGNTHNHLRRLRKSTGEKGKNMMFFSPFPIFCY